MKKDEVIEIAREAGFGCHGGFVMPAHVGHITNQIEAFAAEIERRTLECAAVVCEASPSYDWHKFACEAAAAIRALKEEI